MPIHRVRGQGADGNPALVSVAESDGLIGVQSPGGRPVFLTPVKAQQLRHVIGHAMGEALRGQRWESS